MSNFIPDSQFIPDQPAQGVAPTANFVPDDQFVPDTGLTDEQIVANYQKSQAEFGTPAQQALAFAEAAARGISLGTSDVLAAQLTSPEAVRARQTANPITSLTGNVAGNIGLDVVTGGLAAPAQTALLAKGAAPIAARALAYGAEGALFGAGNTISDAALGDTKINAQKILADVGFGAAIGGGLGLLSKGIEALPILKSKALEQEAIKETPKVIDDLVEIAQPPKSQAEIKKILQESEFMGQGFNELPPKIEELDEAISRLPDLQIKPTELHKQQLMGKSEQDKIKALLKNTPEFEEDFNNLNRVMRKEVDTKIDKTIDSIAPDYKPTENAYEAGERAAKVFKDNYLKEQKEAGQLIGKIKKLDIGTGDHIPPLIEGITKEFPDAAKLFDTTTDQVKLLPYKSTSGISEDAYKAIKTIVNDLDNGARDIGELFNVRKEIDQFVDFSKGGNGAAQVAKIKSIMMDYAQSIIDQSNIDIAAKDAFKRYAYNESEREVIKKLFGVNLKSGAGFDIAPTDVKERILSNIFRDTRSVQAARNILPKEQFNQMLADYMSIVKGQVTKDGVVSSAKLGTLLNDKKQYALLDAFKGQEDKLQRLKDLNTVARLGSDLPSSNPSGTAETLFELNKLKELSETNFAGLVKKYGFEKIQKTLADKELNQRLAGVATQADKVNSVKKIIEKTSKKINNAAKAIFEKSRVPVESTLINLSTEDYNKRFNRLKELSNTTALIQHLDNSTTALNSAVPNITQDINNTMIAGIQFLNSKLPKTQGQFVFDKEFKPNKQQVYTFNKLFNVIDNPISVLGDVKKGLLTDETMLALKAVHPNLLQDMQKSVLENLDNSVKIPYSVKISLSKFLETPLDSSLMPENMLSYQMILGQTTGQQIAKNQAKVTLGGLKELNRAEATETASDRAAKGLE